MCGFPLFSLVSPCYYSLITNRVGITSEGGNRAVIIWGTNDKSGRAPFCSTLCGVVLLQQISIKNAMQVIVIVLITRGTATFRCISATSECGEYWGVKMQKYKPL